ncbi:PIN domain-containing protein [uncultured Thiocystis sp.]|uniref:PIN domain-containing protein n=1 Tax=uncultured Thiocystis sp. TaxID=1202134 RepID=UPI0025D8D401|nr:PIN domain-containing protein [uncultured Thiocystis sp.]
MIIADTGFWVALGNPRDDHHTLALRTFAALQEPLISTWPVMTEVCHLLLQRRGTIAQLKFIELYRQGVFTVFDLHLSHAERLDKLMNAYADLPMDLADASLVLLAEALNHGRILSTDRRDFHAYRWKNTQPFTNLLL